MGDGQYSVWVPLMSLKSSLKKAVYKSFATIV